MLPTIWRAALETRHFTFEAFAPTEEEAREALIAGLVLHADGRYPIRDDWFVEYIDDITVTEYQIGIGYRDREII